jgi:hypothetical protein
MTPAEQLQFEIANLQQSLTDNNPGMPNLLRTIHTKLRADPDIITYLSDEERGIVVSGLMKQTHTIIATATTKKSSNTAKLKSITLDDL